jgi:hypothetical protein
MPIIQIENTAGTPNLSLMISVVGTTITIDPATDIAGNLASTWQEVYNALEEDSAATALFNFALVGADPTNIAQPRACGPIFFPCSMTDENGNGIQVSIPDNPIYTSQIAFVGVRRQSGSLPSLSSSSPCSWKPETYTYVLTGTLEPGQVKGYLAGQAPVQLFQTINDFDFELHQMIVTYSPALSDGMTVGSALMLYDAVKQQIANIPPMDKFWNGAPGSPYEDGGIVPPLVYPQQTQIRVDVFNLLPDSALPVTITIHLVGKNRKPC